MKINRDKELPISYLRECLEYNPATGVLTWRERPLHHFKNQHRCNSWNSRYAGKRAGCFNSGGYLRISINKTSYYVHRVAYAIHHGHWPTDQIDHSEHCRANNRIDNLSVVSNKKNSRNQSMRKNNTSGCTGVCWNKHIQKWVARINAYGKIIHLGYFTDKFEAICARKSAERKYNYHFNHGLAA